MSMEMHATIARPEINRHVMTQSRETERAALSFPNGAAACIRKLEIIQQTVNASGFAVFSTGLWNRRNAVTSLEPVLDGGAVDRPHPAIMAHGEQLVEHALTSSKPVVWRGMHEQQPPHGDLPCRFLGLLSQRRTERSGVAFPANLGSAGSGFVVFDGNDLKLDAEQVIKAHAMAYQVMTCLLKLSVRRISPAERLNDREIACLQLCGDGLRSETIAEKLGLSVHTVNAYLSAATAKLDAVNRIQAIAKALRLGYIA